MSDVFVSHVEQDHELAVKIADALESANFSTWYYERDSLPGRTYIEQVAAALKEANAVLVLISRAALHSPHIRNEVTSAYELDKPFLPVLVNLLHDEFQEHSVFKQAIGAATSISISVENLSESLPRIVAGTRSLLSDRQEQEDYAEASGIRHYGTFSSRPAVLRRLAVMVFGVAAVIGLLISGRNLLKPGNPLERMEAFRQKAEDCLSAVEWPDTIRPILRSWERESLRLDDPVLRSNILSQIRLMNEKAQILAKPAVRLSLQAVADEVAKARDRESTAEN